MPSPIPIPIPILHPAIPQLPSGNLQRTLEFFRDQLGFATYTLYPEHGFLMVRRETAEIHFWQTSTEAEALHFGQASSCYIRVLHIHSLFEEYKGNAVIFRYELQEQPWGMWEMQIDDPYGNAIRFGEDVSRATSSA